MSGQLGLNSIDGNFACCLLFFQFRQPPCFSISASYFCLISLSGGSSERPAKWSMQPQNEDVTHIRFRVVLPVPVNRDSTAYDEDIRGSFLKSYKKEKNFKCLCKASVLEHGSWMVA
jgi:hypothetical protein